MRLTMKPPESLAADRRDLHSYLRGDPLVVNESGLALSARLNPRSVWQYLGQMTQGVGRGILGHVVISISGFSVMLAAIGGDTRANV